MRHRHTVRLRLTLLYGLLFLAAGAGLLAINYALLSRNLPTGRVSTQTGEDVILRSRKMLATQRDLTDAQRITLTKLAQQPATTVAKMVSSGELNGRVPAGLLTSLPLDANRQALHELLVQSLVALAIMAVVAAALGWLVAGRVLRPLAEITATARRLSADNLDDRINLAGPDDELKALADTFDDMLGRLDRAFAGQRRFVANASHELRTPLTIIRTEAEVALRRTDLGVDDLRTTIARVSDAVERCDRLVTSLLALATAEHGIEVVDDVDLADVAHATVGEATAEASEAGVSLIVDTQAAVVRGDPGLLDRLTENLIENGIRHNHPGGWVRVTTRTTDESAHLDVTSTGAVIDQRRVAELFEPFRRLGRDRTSSRGVGLGLSIVRSIVTAHGGHVEAEARAGGGLAVSVRLPNDGTPASSVAPSTSRSL